MLESESRFVNSLKFSSIIFAILTIFTGVMVLVGWAFDIPLFKSISPSFVSMKANSALAFVLSGIALLLIKENGISNSYRNAGKLLALLVSLIGLMSLMQYLLNYNFGIDQLIFSDNKNAFLTASPGRMAANTAICFLLIGLSLIFSDTILFNKLAIGQVPLIFAVAIAFIGLLGYVYSEWELLQILHSTTMAVHTAFLFFILSLGILNSRPRHGIMKRITGESSSSKMLRYLIPSVIIFPLLIDLIVHWGISINLYNSNYEPVFHSIGLSFSLCAMVWVIISKYQQAELKQKAAELNSFNNSQLLQKVLDNIPQRIFWKDIDLNYLGCNKPFAQDAGCSSPEEVVGKSDYELGWSQNAELYRNDDMDVIRTDTQKLQYEEPQFQKDSKKRWLRTSKAPLYNMDGKTIGVLGTYEDISESKLAQLRYETILDTSYDGFWINDLSGKFLQVNNAFCKMIGYSAEELLQMSVNDIEAAEDFNETQKHLEKVIKEGNDFFETKHRRKDGKIIDINVSVNYNRDASLNQMFVFVRDITELKANAEAIRLSEAKYRTLTESSADSIFLIDKNYRVEFANESACRQFQNPKEYVVGKTVAELFPPELSARMRDSISKVFKCGIPSMTEELITFPHSKLWLNTNLMPVVDIHGNIINVLGTSRDITERKLDEESLIREKEYSDKLIDSLPGLFYQISPEGKFIKWNKNFETISGYNSDEMVNVSPLDFFDDVEKNYIAESIQKVFTDGYTAAEANFLSKDGKKTPFYFTGKLININEKNFLSGMGLDVSEMKNAELKLKESEEKFRSLIKSIPFPIGLVDISGNLEYINDRFIKIFGYTLDDVPTLEAWWARAYPDKEYREWVLSTWNNAVEEARIENSDIESIEYEVKCKNGEKRIIIIAGLPLKEGFLATFIDVTDRKKAENQVKESEERIKLILQSTAEGIYGIDLNGKCTFCNKAALQILGFQDEKEVVGKNMHELIHHSKNDGSSYPEKECQIFKTLTMGEGAHSDKEVHWKSNGSSFETEYWSYPIFKEEKIIGAVVSFIDITDRKYTEKMLIHSESRYKGVVNNSPVSLWVEDWTEVINMIDNLKKESISDFKEYFESHPDFVNEALIKVKILEVNNETLKMFKADDKSQLLKSLEVVFATEDTLPGFIGELTALAEGKLLYETEMALRSAKGDLINTFLRMTFPSINDIPGQVLVSIMDITEIKVVEKQIKKAMADLKRSNTELEQFAYVASHDLQEPLRMVSSYTQLLEKRYKDKLDDDAKDFINFAVDGANRMQRLINDLLEYSRVTTRGKEFAKVDLSSVLGVAVANLQRKIHDLNAMVTNDELPVCHGDEGQLVRLFQNLIDNSLKFNNNSSPRIHISSQTKDEKIIVSLSDNGIGIEKKYEDRIFTIFQRLHNKMEYPGTGIGLAICKRTVERHGGQIWFESEPGNGTTFYFSLTS